MLMNRILMKLTLLT